MKSLIKIKKWTSELIKHQETAILTVIQKQYCPKAVGFKDFKKMKTESKRFNF